MAEEQKQPAAQAISEPQQPAAQATESQVTSQTPAKIPSKNPKRVAAGKAVAERTRLARQAQKKAAAEAAVIIANNNGKKSAPAHAPVAETEPQPAEADSKGLSTTQWISIIGIGATLLTAYVKREDLKTFFGKEKATAQAPAPAHVQEPVPYVLQQQPKKGIRPMD